MNKLQKIVLGSIFAYGTASADGSFGLHEMHKAAEAGTAFFLQQTGKSAIDIKGYAVGQQDDGAKLRIFFKDGSQGKLFCHVHELEEIDCHIL